MLLLITSCGLTFCLYCTRIAGLSVMTGRLYHTQRHAPKTIAAACLLAGDVRGRQALLARTDLKLVMRK